MTMGALHIGDLRLRVRGISDDQARRLGELVGARLAEQAPTRSRRIRAMTIRIRSRATTSIDDLASQIADRLRDQLK